MGRWGASMVFVVVLVGPAAGVAAAPQDSEPVQPLRNDAGVQGGPRVRGSSPAVAQAIEGAWEQSPTFKQLVATINRTDGIVFVHHDKCGRNVLACLLLGVTRAGSHRMLHIRVDKRRRGLDLMVSIGHELQHAVEVLREPAVVDTASIRLFYERLAPTNRFAFETQAAIESGLKVDGELRAWRKRQRAVTTARESL
jgi:hypothetical protein